MGTETAMLLLSNIINTEWVFTAHKSLDVSKSTEGHNPQWSPGDDGKRWHQKTVALEFVGMKWVALKTVEIADTGNRWHWKTEAKPLTGKRWQDRRPENGGNGNR